MRFDALSRLLRAVCGLADGAGTVSRRKSVQWGGDTAGVAELPGDYNGLMTDSADHLAAAIRQIVRESVEAALRTHPPTSPLRPPPGDPPTDRMLYSVKEVQMKLGISRSTVYHLLNDGHLASARDPMSLSAAMARQILCGLPGYR